MSPSKFQQMESYMIEFEEEGIKHVKMFVIITLAYIIFWGPLFLVTLINISLDWKDAKSSVSHEVSLFLIKILNSTKENSSIHFYFIGVFQRKYSQ